LKDSSRWTLPRTPT